jgi:hypothetical protein
MREFHARVRFAHSLRLLLRSPALCGWRCITLARKELPMKVEIGDATLYCGDCLAVLRTLPESSVDAVVTDPPYGLSFMGKRWDYDVPSVEIWAECLRVLKPGGHLLAFAGTRTQHRMAVRIEDAGFEIRDMIAWVYGSGFPKSHNLKNEWQGWGTALKPALEADHYGPQAALRGHRGRERAGAWHWGDQCGWVQGRERAGDLNGGAIQQRCEGLEHGDQLRHGRERLGESAFDQRAAGPPT